MSKLESPKGIIFDLDGTLVSTDFLHREFIIKNVMRDLNKSTPSKNLIDKFWFEGNRAKTIFYDFGVDVSDFWESYVKHDTTELRKRYTAPFYDVEVLKDFKEMGYKLGIVSSGPKKMIDLEVEMIEKETQKGIFESIMCAHRNSGLKPKPDPEGIIKCLQSLSLKNYETIFVGNSDEDMGAAKNAFVTAVHLDRKEYDYKGFNGSEPDLEVGSLSTLKDVLLSGEF